VAEFEMAVKLLVYLVLKLCVDKQSMNMGPCHHGVARPQVADGGTASYMESSCE
jgi:hypothetical protein